MSGKSTLEKDAKRMEMLEAEVAKAEEEIRRRQEAVSEKKAEIRKIRARLKYAERKKQEAALRSAYEDQQSEIERLREENAALKKSTSMQNRDGGEIRTNEEITADDSLTEGQRTIELMAARVAAGRRNENALAPDTREPYVQESTDAVGQLF